MIKNYRLIISYDGTNYSGWAGQKNTDKTVQGKIEKTLERLLGVGQGELSLTGAGRTDSGVHANAMTANVHLDTEMSPEDIRKKLNRYLPEDICIKEIDIVSDRFHSRYNAKGKTYVYTCYAGDGKPVFDRKYVYALDRQPDIEAMRRAAAYLVGTHDFMCFCGNSKMKKSTVRTINGLDIDRRGDYITFTVSGDGFLQNMVRIIVGTLLETGFGLRSAENIAEVLDARDRSKAGFTAPAQGLRLEKVYY